MARPDDEDRYVLDRYDARRSFAALDTQYPDARVCFFGHTHVAMVVRQERSQRWKWGMGRANRLFALESGASLELDEDCRYLINPGSVGQPRDGNPAAAFGVFDADRKRYTQYRVSYRIADAQRKIRALGLPVRLAERLAVGR